MSQPTRARTTGAAPRKPRKSTEAVPEPHLTPTPTTTPTPASETTGTAEASVPMAPETLARTLRAVAAELERDPALARRVADAIGAPQAGTGSVTVGARPASPAPDAPIESVDEPETGPVPTGKAKRRVNESFRPRLITGTSPELGSGIPDPFALYAKKGEMGLREALAELRLGTLRAMVREHKLDPQGRVGKLNDAEKLRELILSAAAERGA